MTVVTLSAEMKSLGAKVNHFFDDTLNIPVKKGWNVQLLQITITIY